MRHVDSNSEQRENYRFGSARESLDLIFEEYLQFDNPVRDGRKDLALGLIKSKRVRSVAQKKRGRALSTRMVFDYLKRTRTCCHASTV